MRTLAQGFTPEQQLAEVEDLLRTVPAWTSIRNPEPENYAWFGRASAVVKSWDSFKALQMSARIEILQSGRLNTMNSYGSVMTTLHEMRHDLRMRTVGPLSVAISPGQVFDYFDEVRKVIEGARVDIFFVDAYLDAEFVSRTFVKDLIFPLLDDPQIAGSFTRYLPSKKQNAFNRYVSYNELQLWPLLAYLVPKIGEVIVEKRKKMYMLWV